MRQKLGPAVSRLLLNVLGGGYVLGAVSAQAAPFELIYTGTFATTEALNVASASTPTFFTNSTPFTIHALFDDSSLNLAPSAGGPFTGFRAYAPSSATIEITGTLYGIETSVTSPSAGVTVAIFDQNSFTPGRYGIGLIADPVADSAGIVGDFTSASPNLIAAALTPTVCGDYYGVGHGSGVCLSGSPPACPHAVTPWVLRDGSNVVYSLTLGNFDEDFPVAHTPGALIGPLNSAQILAASAPVPEPAAYLTVVAGLLGLAWSRRKWGVGAH